ncbi:MAG: DNRLRE domain-containing protein, partial [Anaerolineales bacterium]
GNTNYASYSQINVQNQWDISDWPCFSKFYITFPLDTLPKGKTIISAKLSMTLFGNAGGGNWGDPPDSFIQVLTVNDIWDEAKLTWNNAPLAQENIAGIWVKPRDYSLYYETYTWEIRPAVETAYNSGQPLRLALYSADGEQHTGKYFWTSDSTDWDGNIRPTLEIVWGDDCSAPGITCHFQYLPLTSR